MFFDTIIAFDHFFQTIKIIAHLRVPSTLEDVPAAYHSTGLQIRNIAAFLQSPGAPLPKQLKGTIGASFTSNIGRQGYEDHVTALKKDILAGNIIQAVPSQRLSRPTTLHPFNIYRRLRTVNPSPYLFYIDCQDFQIIGASPELLVKTENNIEEGRIITHPIAGTILRGDTTEQDHKLAEQLRQSLKDRAEHVMLVDLARNDVNRVCDPLTTKVDRLMVVEKFSHVQHLVSQVSGVLRRQDGEGLHGEGMTRFDAFRSIFPAGTVSGAPKVRAMEIIAEREGEKRGVYAGAVGWWGYDTSRVKKGELDSMQETTIVREEGSMDTCIALRTMVMKDGVIYLQAGGGIVFDSDPAEEWMETINKLKANIMCVESAEEMYRDGEGDGTNADMWKKILLRDLETPAASVDMDVDQPHVEVGAA